MLHVPNFIARSHSPLPASVPLDLADGPIDVRIRSNRRARRMTLRHDAATGETVLTLPDRAPLAEAIDFLEAHRDWIESRRNRIGRPRPFVSGMVLPLRGIDHLITGTGKTRGTVAVAEATEGPPRILVPGGAAHLHRRLSDWLRAEARRDLTQAVERYTAELGTIARRIAVRDQRSRWGSCSAAGHLSFSWRLVLAPGFVLDYVAAHEVAHLIEMNHSPRFWAEVDKTSADRAKAERWLRAHGSDLHRYGRQG